MINPNFRHHIELWHRLWHNEPMASIKKVTVHLPEELLEQAQANDYGDLLSSVFSTSDIGKLYKVLCEIAGRNSRDH